MVAEGDNGQTKIKLGKPKEEPKKGKGKKEKESI
jgi:hypothetical protein